MPTKKTPFRQYRSVQFDMNPSADCQECQWSASQSYSTLANAKAHVEQTGHEVVVDRVSRSVYAGVAR